MRCFLICKSIYIFWKFIQCTIQNANVKNISFGLNKRSKICTLFLSRAPTHHSFTFNLQFLYELKHKVFLSKSACGILHFRFRLVFIKVCIFVQQKAWILWLENAIIPFKIKIMEKPLTVLLPELWFEVATGSLKLQYLRRTF